MQAGLMWLLWLSFNPRVRAGRDGHGRVLAAKKLGFNPRVRAGRDEGNLTAAIFYLFQSTRPRGTRL